MPFGCLWPALTSLPPVRARSALRSRSTLLVAIPVALRLALCTLRPWLLGPLPLCIAFTVALRLPFGTLWPWLLWPLPLLLLLLLRALSALSRLALSWLLLSAALWLLLPLAALLLALGRLAFRLLRAPVLWLGSFRLLLWLLPFLWLLAFGLLRSLLRLLATALGAAAAALLFLVLFQCAQRYLAHIVHIAHVGHLAGFALPRLQLHRVQLFGFLSLAVQRLYLAHTLYTQWVLLVVIAIAVPHQVFENILLLQVRYPLHRLQVLSMIGEH